MERLHKRRLIHGKGVNDSDYVTEKKAFVNGKKVRIWICPFFQKWVSMLYRCYSKANLKRQPSYVGCSVSDDWLKFSKFKSWMETQDWEGKDLDKDLLVKGNKLYSADSCVFVDPFINNFILDRGRFSGRYPTGVSLFKRDGNFRAQCNNPFTKTNEHVGYFDTPDLAALAWRDKKRYWANILADTQTDVRISEALRSRY